VIDIFVINLDRRPDRLQHMSTQLKEYKWIRCPAADGKDASLKSLRMKGWYPDVLWRDPLLKRQLTNTEVGCFISHYKCWEKIVETNRPAIIFEDDIELIKPFDLEEIGAIVESCDILYLGYREMSEAVDVGTFLQRPTYPYLLSSYCLTPSGAKKLIDTHIKNNIIPVDEYVPLMIGYDHVNNPDANINMRRHVEEYKKYSKLHALAYKDPYVRQLSRSVLGSDIENGDNMIQRQTHIVTVASDQDKAILLRTSAERFAIPLNNLGLGVVWEGGDMTGPGGGQKINLVKSFLNTVDENDLVLFVDGYDVIINDNIQTIVERYNDMGGDVVVAAEKNCWPSKDMEGKFPPSHTAYRYPNSGLYIGRAGSLKLLFGEEITNRQDDQLYLQQAILKSPEMNVRVVLDVENYIFQCIASTNEAEVIVKANKQLLNTETRCCPCILHGNGGERDKLKFENTAEALGISTSEVNFLPTGNSMEVVGPEVLQIDFMTPTECKKLIDKAEKYGQWESMYGDKFPGQELRLRILDINLFNKLEEHFKQHINPVIEKYWWPLQMYGLRDAFIIKYTPLTQKSLACHHDASLVSTIVYLNEDYEGGDTYFPRQKYSTENVPVGKMVLWPGQVTHGHEGREVKSGSKYALVIWTQRRPGDVNY
jgi:GR25 family glycosyltransferase involved in LPS biosynthesis